MKIFKKPLFLVNLLGIIALIGLFCVFKLHIDDTRHNIEIVSWLILSGVVFFNFGTLIEWLVNKLM